MVYMKMVGIVLFSNKLVQNVSPSFRARDYGESLCSGKGVGIMTISNRGNMGIRIIVFMGAATFLFLMLMAFGLKKSLQPPVGARVPEGAATSPFQEDRAWADLVYLTSLHTSPGDSPVENVRQDYILTQLRNAGLRIRRFPFESDAPGEPTARTSLAGIVEGNRPGILLLCGAMADSGSETGAANTAWLLEMARILGGRRDGRSIWFVFLDAEEAPVKEESNDVFEGSRKLVEALRAAGDLSQIDGVFAFNGIGDCQLNLRKEAGAPAAWLEILGNTAKREGYDAFLGKLPGRVRGGHLAFRDAGIPAMALVDDSATVRRRQAAPSSADEGFEACRESLRAVGDVIYHALAPIEGHLDQTGMRIDGH